MQRQACRAARGQDAGAAALAGLLGGLASGLALLYRSAQQALRWYPRPGPSPWLRHQAQAASLSVVLCWPAAGSGHVGRETAVKARPGPHSAGLHGCPAFLRGRSPALSSLKSARATSPQSTADPALGLLSKPKRQLPAVAAHCRGRASCPGMWCCGQDGLRTVPGGPLHSPGASDCLLSRTVAPTGIGPLLRPRSPSCCHGCRSGPAQSPLSPSRVLPGSLHSSPVPGRLPAFSWCPVRSSASEGVFLTHP